MKHRRFWQPVFPLTTLSSECIREERTSLILWLGLWVGLIREHLPNCSGLCSSCFYCFIVFPPQGFHGLFCKFRNSELAAMWFSWQVLVLKFHALHWVRMWDLAGDSQTPALCLYSFGLPLTQGIFRIFLATDFLSLVSTNGFHLDVILSTMGYLAVSENIFCYYNLKGLLGSTRWRPGMLPNIPQCTGHSPKQPSLAYSAHVALVVKPQEQCKMKNRGISEADSGVFLYKI